MDKINLKKEQDNFGVESSEPTVKAVEEAKLFEDASPEMLKEAIQREEKLKATKKWTFIRYLKEIHTSPLKTLRDETLPGARYSVGHILLACLLCTGINFSMAPVSAAIEELGFLQMITGLTYVSFLSMLVVYCAVLFNNFMVGSFIYVFGKSLSVTNKKGDYKMFLRNLFPLTSMVAIVQYLVLPLVVTTVGTKTQMAINITVACIPSFIAYCSLKTVAWRGVFVYVVLGAWLSLFYFMLGDKIGL